MKRRRIINVALAGLVSWSAAPPARAAEPELGFRAGANPSHAPSPSHAMIRRGDDRFTGGEASRQEPQLGGMVSLNLVEVPLPVAAKAVLADTFGWGYTLDERAVGTITLQTGGQVTRDTLLSMFETALSSRATWCFASTGPATC